MYQYIPIFWYKKKSDNHMTWLIWDHNCYFLSNDLSNKSSILSILWSLSLCCVSIWSISFEFCASNFSIRSVFKLGLIFFFGNSAFVSNVSSLSPFSNFLFKHSLVFGYSFSRPVSKDTLSFVDALFPYAPSNASLSFQSIRSAPVFELWSFISLYFFFKLFHLLIICCFVNFSPSPFNSFVIACHKESCDLLPQKSSSLDNRQSIRRFSSATVQIWIDWNIYTLI